MFTRRINEKTEVALGVPQFAEELYELTDTNRTFLKKWLPWLDSIKEPNDTKKFIAGELQRFAEGKGLFGVIFYEGRIAGVVGFNLIESDNQSGHIGYWLGEAYNGKGLMTDSVKDLIELGKEHYSLRRFEIRCAVENSKSRAIPERLGFVNEGTLRSVEKVYDKWYDHVVYGLVV
ncbi:GNAT family N-acetyltransferase [Pelagicoccus mobilis]|uniref:GNAT family N-acetyltransferase n=1 Tax=Pelagicoccus mobilis TaxID=415221 RepID=A0A934RVC6_9BACT|nr:GNAT family N-acetyltransferase [Pelagicoccus mobilis]MBK1877078.1 GNAT family N-acetyltransferase [Pelagicoccus mobilis]